MLEPLHKVNLVLWQVQSIQSTLHGMLADLKGVHDAFTILWWRVLAGVPPNCCTRALQNSPLAWLCVAGVCLYVCLCLCLCPGGGGGFRGTGGRRYGARFMVQSFDCVRAVKAQLNSSVALRRLPIISVPPFIARICSTKAIGRHIGKTGCMCTT